MLSRSRNGLRLARARSGASVALPQPAVSRCRWLLGGFSGARGHKQTPVGAAEEVQQGAWADKLSRASQNRYAASSHETFTFNLLLCCVRINLSRRFGLITFFPLCRIC